MKFFTFALLTALAYCRFASAGDKPKVEVYPVIAGKTIQDLFFPTLDMGSGPKEDTSSGAQLEDLKGRLLADQWPERIQYDVVGIALAILLDIKKNIRYEKEEQVDLLFIGSLAENNYGLLGASEILSYLGFKIHIYIIQDEGDTDNLEANHHVKQWLRRTLNQNKKGNHGNIIFENITDIKDIDVNLEDKCPVIKKFKKEILTLVKEKEYKEAENLVKNVKEKLKGSTALPTFDTRKIENRINRVYAGISGASADEWYFKVGEYYAFNFLAVAQKLGKLWSIDYCSGWKDDAVSIPKLYAAAGLQPLIANGLIHIGGMKPFVKVPECKGMKHVVVIPFPLYEALTSTDPFINFKNLYGSSPKNNWPKTLYNIVKRREDVKADNSTILVDFEFRNIIVKIPKEALEHVVKLRTHLDEVNPYNVFAFLLRETEGGNEYDDIFVNIEDRVVKRRTCK